MESKGIVQEVKGDKIVVLPYKASGCGGCNHCSEGEKYSLPIELTVDFEVKPGDEISFSVDSKEVVKAGFIAYIIPVIFFFAGYAISSFFTKIEVYKIISSFASLMLGFILTAVVFKLLNKDDSSKLTVKKEAGQNCQCS